MAIEARGGAAAVVSETVSLTTGELPLPIRSLRLRSDRAASSGFTLIAPLLPDSSLAATGFLVAFDSAGDIRWYHPFPGTWPIEASNCQTGTFRCTRAAPTVGSRPLASSSLARPVRRSAPIP